LARLLSAVEAGGDDARAVGRATHPLGGNAHTIGVTGAPGSGKSTLTNALLTVMRRAGERAAVLAVDPSSPFSGGAILGDRVRMQDHALDPDVFIRSMASRGHLGGLALATPEAIRVLDAAGFPWIVVETVGVGQVEVEVAGAADTTVVVLNPGWGDTVQAAKAGLLEVADVFAVNKADRPGADDVRRDLDQMLDLASIDGWRPPIVATTATASTGVDDLWRVIGEHRAHLRSDGRLERRRVERARDELARIVAARLVAQAEEGTRWGQLDELVVRVAKRELDPWSAADELVGDGVQRSG
jgi:LAO/AO transport system kinase